jgi:hypothetical protein
VIVIEKGKTVEEIDLVNVRAHVHVKDATDVIEIVNVAELRPVAITAAAREVTLLPVTLAFTRKIIK